MAAITDGTAHFFGTNGAVVANATISSVNIEEGYALDTTTIDEDGKVIERRFDSVQFTGTVELFVRTGYSFPNLAAGTVLALSGLHNTRHNQNYRVTGTPQTYTAGDKMRVSLNIERHANANVA